MTALRARARAGVPALVLMAAATVHALAFTPGPLPLWALPVIQLLTLAVLVRRSLRASSVRRAFGSGVLFGVTTYSVGLYWLYISMHVYGYMAAPLAAGGVVALSLYLSLYIGLACALARWLTPWRDDAGGATPRRVLFASLVWAAAWTVGEWLRGVILTGFPWLNIGYAHVDSPLAGWAPVVGVYGMAFWAAFGAAALASLWRTRTGVQTTDARRSLTAGVALAVALAGWLLHQIGWVKPAGQPLTVELVQGNVPQSQKFDPASMEAGIVAQMKWVAFPAGETAAAPTTPPDLILLPETVLPVFQDQVAPEVWETWRRLSIQRQSPIVMGAPLRTQLADRTAYTNSVIAIDANTSVEELMRARPAWRYDKQHLVPFGEFVPTGFRWFVNAMQIPLGDFDRGASRQTPLTVADQRLGFNVCYEDLFGEELLPALHPGQDGSPGATILANVSNLGWFGDSWALPQHLQIARLRTLETGRPMLASTNTGITAAIDHEGQVLATLPTHQAGVLTVQVQGMTGLTPYARVGNLAVLLSAVALLLTALARRLQVRRRSTVIK